MDGEFLCGFDELVAAGTSVLVRASKFFSLEENVKAFLNRIVLIQFLKKMIRESLEKVVKYQAEIKEVFEYFRFVVAFFTFDGGFEFSTKEFRDISGFKEFRSGSFDESSAGFLESVN